LQVGSIAGLFGNTYYRLLWSVGVPCTAPLAGIDPTTIDGYDGTGSFKYALIIDTDKCAKLEKLSSGDC
jgi:hypothetical protein